MERLEKKLVSQGQCSVTRRGNVLRRKVGRVGKVEGRICVGSGKLCELADEDGTRMNPMQEILR